MPRRNPTAALTLALLLTGCGSPAPDGAAPSGAIPSTDIPYTDIPISSESLEAPRLEGPELDRTARFLAGLETTDAVHAERLDGVWRELEDRHLGAMRAWSREVLAPRLGRPELPLFYPFGGPDFLGAHTFFPEATTYVLIGLQPPGPSPDLAALDRETLEGELVRLADAFSNLVVSGYFVTTRMDADFASPHLSGVLPALLVFLARTGHRPVSLAHLRLDAEGRLVAAPPSQAKAVRLEFVDAAAPAARRSLVYLAYDLSDAGFAEHPGFARHLRSLAPWNVLIKSGEFLLHMPELGGLADLLLAEAPVILQDDSGLPFRAFDPGRWRLTLFGRYTETQPAAYRKWLQDDLLAAYAAGAEPLDFSIGYGSQLGSSALILAARRAP